ncbi:hypothetical protein HYH03_008927 [Edaphochlamys debaryana]|uniref:OTU domain-containing protein n=1 Tax=Edaphochlamys debaryana TaxID=47281 RepID=A0A836BY97_9CHLO|nr:hypothetical protein HYH03_008927 [Edaphochlamys debaryana]|eukprot:KAG2492762.1 hypothetical protein HYH03_008927 [Edaphochlamys debaryana]
MTTTYRAAFGNPSAHQPVVESLAASGKSKLPSKPDTSCDSAIARAIMEEELYGRYQESERKSPTSPTGIHIGFKDTFDNPVSQAGPSKAAAPAGPARPGGQAGPGPGPGGPSKGPVQALKAQAGHRRAASEGSGSAPSPSAPRAPPTGSARSSRPGTPVDDAALARQLQRVELAAVEDATGAHANLLFPGLLSEPSCHELQLGRTLSRAPSIRISPHVLAASQFPTEPVVSADRQRLLQTLKVYDLAERQVAGDGNCQFRALSDQLYGNPDHHAAVRSAVVSQLRRNAEAYKGYVPQEYGAYCTGMAKSSTWGDHVTLQAAADTYGMKITVVTSFEKCPVINIEPARQTSGRTLFLSFWAEVHYNSIYPGKEAPPLGATSAGALPPPTKPTKVLGSKVLGRVVDELSGRQR